MKPRAEITRVTPSRISRTLDSKGDPYTIIGTDARTYFYFQADHNKFKPGEEYDVRYVVETRVYKNGEKRITYKILDFYHVKAE